MEDNGSQWGIIHLSHDDTGWGVPIGLPNREGTLGHRAAGSLSAPASEISQVPKQVVDSEKKVNLDVDNPNDTSRPLPLPPDFLNRHIYPTWLTLPVDVEDSALAVTVVVTVAVAVVAVVVAVVPRSRRRNGSPSPSSAVSSRLARSPAWSRSTCTPCP